MIVVENIDIFFFYREWSWGVLFYELKYSLDNYFIKLFFIILVYFILELMEFNKNIVERVLKYG